MAVQVERLAHPFRVPLHDKLLGLWQPLVGESAWSEVLRLFAAPEVATAEIIAQLLRDERLIEFHKAAAAMGVSPSGSGFGVLLGIFEALRQQYAPQPVFVIEDALVSQLELTDVPEDIPVGMLALPYPRCYVEIGTARTTSLRVPNIESGLHILEGAYLHSGVTAAGPSVSVMLTGSPIGHAGGPLDDATLGVMLPADDPARSLCEALKIACREADTGARAWGLRETGDLTETPAFQAILMVVKALLYIGLPDIRKEMHAERSEALRQLEARKSGAKRAKLERKLESLRDFILVKAPSGVRVSGGEGGRSSPSAHWRRGHYRMQVHGEGRAQRKLIHVPPTLVNPAKAPSSAPRTPEYKVS